MNIPSDKIAANWHAVMEEVAEAAITAGRRPEEIRIVGVSKYVNADTTQQLVEAGCTELGESRPQALWDKAASLADMQCHWHFIGHLQRNKVKRTLPLVTWVHSVDSVRLARAISDAVQELQLSDMQCLLEINVSGDTAKHGLAAEQAFAALTEIAELPGVKVKGLMAMASYGSSGAAAQRDFAALTSLRERLVTSGLPPNISLQELSMGMSGDFRAAIAEGSTMVRIGSRLFE